MYYQINKTKINGFVDLHNTTQKKFRQYKIPRYEYNSNYRNEQSISFHS